MRLSERRRVHVGRKITDEGLALRRRVAISDQPTGVARQVAQPGIQCRQSDDDKPAGIVLADLPLVALRGRGIFDFLGSDHSIHGYTGDAAVAAPSSRPFVIARAPVIRQQLAGVVLAGKAEKMIYHLKMPQNAIDIPSLKTTIVEGEYRGPVHGYHANVDDHVANLRPEFAGLPELCVAHARLIVLIRRKLDLLNTVNIFLQLWQNEYSFLCKHLNSRWLISACDTFVDHGSTSLQRALALVGTTLINVVKLSETERIGIRDNTVHAQRLNTISAAHANGRFVELWDGMTAYDTITGDMPKNLFERIIRLSGEDPALHCILTTLIERAADGNNLIGRLEKLNHSFLPKQLQEHLNLLREPR